MIKMIGPEGAVGIMGRWEMSTIGKKKKMLKLPIARRELREAIQGKSPHIYNRPEMIEE